MGRVYVPSQVWRKESLLSSKPYLLLTQLLCNQSSVYWFCFITVELFLKKLKTWTESLKCWNGHGFELKEGLLLLSPIKPIICAIDWY